MFFHLKILEVFALFTKPVKTFGYFGAYHSLFGLLTYAQSAHSPNKHNFPSPSGIRMRLIGSTKYVWCSNFHRSDDMDGCNDGSSHKWHQQLENIWTYGQHEQTHEKVRTIFLQSSYHPKIFR